MINYFKFFLYVLTIIAHIVGDLTLVQSARSTPSSSEATGATGSSSNHESSLIPSSTRHHRRGGSDRELISAQYRADRAQDAHSRDLDTSDTNNAGVETPAGLEDDHLPLKYMAASASAYSPAKTRMNRYSQTGFYDPYPSVGVFPSSVPSSYYPYNGYNYKDSNPMLDNYPFYERDRIRELRERAMQASQSQPYSSSSSSSSSNRDGFGSGSNFFGGGGMGLGLGGGGYREGHRSSDNDNTAMSSGHGHEEHGHNHGWGWKSEYTSKVNTNAIGLLGLLGLLSLLSNVLLLFTTTTTTTTAAAGRRRRKRAPAVEEAEFVETAELKRRREAIFMEILPHLAPIAHATDGFIPSECTFRGVCMANRVLANELGIHGRSAGQRITSAVVKLLDKTGGVAISRKKKDEKEASLKKELESAGLNGRNRKDCEKLYPVCSRLKGGTSPTLPFVIRMADLPKLISKVSSMTKDEGKSVSMQL